MNAACSVPAICLVHAPILVLASRVALAPISVPAFKTDQRIVDGTRNSFGSRIVQRYSHVLRFTHRYRYSQMDRLTPVLRYTRFVRLTLRLRYTLTSRVLAARRVHAKISDHVLVPVCA